MKNPTALTRTEKKSLEGYLDTIRQAVDLEEYAMALTALESLKEIIVDKLMIVHHGDNQSQ